MHLMRQGHVLQEMSSALRTRPGHMSEESAEPLCVDVEELNPVILAMPYPPKQCLTSRTVLMIVLTCLCVPLLWLDP